MKQAVWLMILAISFWTIDRDQWISQALGASTTTSLNVNVTTTTTTMTAANGSIITAVTYRTQTQTSVNTLTSTGTNSGPSTNTGTGSSTDTNCHTGGGQYGGGQWNYCNRNNNNNQDNTQEDNKNLNDNGADKSTMLGMAAIAAGMAMVAAGMALLPNPPTAAAGAALIAAGMALIAAGMAALAAASKMNKNANTSGYNAGKMDNLNNYKSTIADDNKPKADGVSQLGDVKKVDMGDGNTSGIKIDPALLRNGKMDAIYGDLESKTGINRDDFAKGMRDGMNPLDMLSNSPALAGNSLASADNLQKMLNDSAAKGLPNGSDIMSQLGLSNSDLGIEMKAGGGAARTPANTGPNLDALFPNSAAQTGASVGNSQSAGSLGLSPEVQAALDKNGITGRSIFEMVHTQYVKKTPLMFGVQERKDNDTAENPFTGLDSKLDH